MRVAVTMCVAVIMCVMTTGTRTGRRPHQPVIRMLQDCVIVGHIHECESDDGQCCIPILAAAAHRNGRSCGRLVIGCCRRRSIHIRHDGARDKVESCREQSQRQDKPQRDTVRQTMQPLLLKCGRRRHDWHHDEQGRQDGAIQDAQPSGPLRNGRESSRQYWLCGSCGSLTFKDNGRWRLAVIVHSSHQHAVATRIVIVHAGSWVHEEFAIPKRGHGRHGTTAAGCIVDTVVAAAAISTDGRAVESVASTLTLPARRIGAAQAWQ